MRILEINQRTEDYYSAETFGHTELRPISTDSTVCNIAEIEVYPVLDAAVLDFSLPVESYNIPGFSIG